MKEKTIIYLLTAVLTISVLAGCQRKEEKNSEKIDMDLNEEQRTWIKRKEDKIELAGAQYEGGSIQPLIRNRTASELTRIRCYELAAYLAKAAGWSFDLEVPEPVFFDVDKFKQVNDTYGHSKHVMERMCKKSKN